MFRKNELILKHFKSNILKLKTNSCSGFKNIGKIKTSIYAKNSFIKTPENKAIISKRKIVTKIL